jgi:hypothetical protein
MVMKMGGWWRKKVGAGVKTGGGGENGWLVV